jgi:hypothetical protein
MTAPIASGRSDLAGWVSHPLVKRRLCTAHAKSSHSIRIDQRLKKAFHANQILELIKITERIFNR